MFPIHSLTISGRNNLDLDLGNKSLVWNFLNSANILILESCTVSNHQGGEIKAFDAKEMISYYDIIDSCGMLSKMQSRYLEINKSVISSFKPSSRLSEVLEKLDIVGFLKINGAAVNIHNV